MIHSKSRWLLLALGCLLVCPTVGDAQQPGTKSDRKQETETRDPSPTKRRKSAPAGQKGFPDDNAANQAARRARLKRRMQDGVDPANGVPSDLKKLKARGSGPDRSSDRGPTAPERLRGFLRRAAQWDTNQDRKLSLDEVPPMLKRRFPQIDTNQDQQIDRSELVVALQKMQPAMQDRLPNSGEMMRRMRQQQNRREAVPTDFKPVKPIRPGQLK